MAAICEHSNEVSVSVKEGNSRPSEFVSTVQGSPSTMELVAAVSYLTLFTMQVKILIYVSDKKGRS
jgi:hypothetical protein